MKSFFVTLTAIALGVGGLSGCANMDETQRDTGTGAAIGAVAGGLIGAMTAGGHTGRSAATGAAIGAAVGAGGGAGSASTLASPLLRLQPASESAAARASRAMPAWRRAEKRRGKRGRR